MSIAAFSKQRTYTDDEFMIIDGQMIIFAEENAHVVTVTPAEAELLLARSHKNRKFDQLAFKRLVNSINDDDFTFNGASICLSTFGRPLDGQHRMAAVIETGKPQKFVIVTGVHDRAQASMDTGKGRTLGHNLRMNGELYETELSAAITGIQAWENGERATQTSVRAGTIDRSLRFLEAHPEIRTIVREAVVMKGRSKPNRVPSLTAKALCQFIWAFDKINVDDRKAFFEQLGSGAGLELGHPILQLRNYLQANEASKAKVTAYQLAGMTCKAWNYWREGETKKVTFNAGGSKAERFPEPR